MFTNAVYNFPIPSVIQEKMSQHPILSDRYSRNKGITQAISQLASERFGGKQGMQEDDINLGVSLMMHDLKNGVNGLTGKPLPKFEFDRQMWAILSMSTKKAIRDCIESTKSE